MTRKVIILIRNRDTCTLGFTRPPASRLSMHFSWSERRSNVKTFRETLEKLLELPTQKMRSSAIIISRQGVFESIGSAYAIFCGYSSRRFSSVSLLLLQGPRSPYVFLNFNGDFTTIETAQKRSVKRLSNAQARCQLWSLR